MHNSRKKGMKAVPIECLSLSTNCLSPPLLPAKGIRGLCRSMVVTFRQVLSLRSGERNSVLPFKVMGREWGNKLNGPHLLQLGRSNG